jgi:hypothetical protein
VQLIHDLAHYVVARSRGVKLGVPIFLPSLQVGKAPVMHSAKSAWSA